MLRFLIPLMIATGLTTALHGQESQPEKIPAPKLVQPVPPAPILFESNTPRTGSVEVWQHYGVNRLGRFVPRVIVVPGAGAVYSRDLQPFPWLQNRSSAVMPYVID